jgi:tripartite-type tricarboxylate transporter receptor subunit TctC
MKLAKSSSKVLIAMALTVTAVASGVTTVQAQNLPDPIRLVVGYPPGGTADAVARVYAEKLRAELGVGVVVDNRAGAGGQVAAQAFVRSPKDGSALLVANNHMLSTLPLTVKTVAYDPVKDFQPVAPIAKFEHILAVGKNTPASSLDEYIALVRKQAEVYGMYGIPAPGSAPQFIGYSIAKKNDLKMTPVPYRGGAPLLSDLLGGHVPAAVDAIGTITEYVAKGEVKILGVTGPQRLEILKDVPTFVELGYGNLNASGWMGIFAPVGTDPAIVQRLNQAFNKVSAMPEIAKAIVPIGFAPHAGSPEELAEIVKNDLDTWGPIIRESGYVAQ